MNERDRHVPTDRLMALAFAPRHQGADLAGPGGEERLWEHLAVCEACAAALGRFTADAEGVRDLALADADRQFDAARLDAQRTRILDRLAHLGQAARVLSFPSRRHEVALPVSSTSRRWISVAAAAGLIIGLVAGQMLHFMPAPAGADRTGDATISRPAEAGRIVPAAAGPGALGALSDDELLEEIESSIQLRRARSLHAIDALTPTAADLLALGR